MGIAPITNLTPLSGAREIQADLEPLPMQRVENSSRTGDETYSPSNGKSARGEANEGSEQDLEDPEEDSTEERGEDGQTGQISFFA